MNIKIFTLISIFGLMITSCTNTTHSNYFKSRIKSPRTVHKTYEDVYKEENESAQREAEIKKKLEALKDTGWSLRESENKKTPPFLLKK